MRPVRTPGTHGNFRRWDMSRDCMGCIEKSGLVDSKAMAKTFLDGETYAQEGMGWQAPHAYASTAKGQEFSLNLRKRARQAAAEPSEMCQPDLVFWLRRLRLVLIQLRAQCVPTEAGYNLQHRGAGVAWCRPIRLNLDYCQLQS